MLRIVENNDWVIYSIVAIVIVYIISSRLINHGLSFWGFLKEPIEYATNIVVNWILVSVSLIFIISVFLCQYIPIVPKEVIDNVDVNGFTLNKFGFLFVSLLFFYFFKCLFSYLFYLCSLNGKRWKGYIFNLNKFFAIAIIIFSVLSIAQYYYPIDRNIAFNYYVLLLIVLILCKIVYLLINPTPSLPKEWYYKILYICTLQILPYLVIWDFLFF